MIALALVGSEVLMGILFAVGGGNAPATPGAALALGLSSVWFDWSMAAVMVALLLWLPVSGLVRGLLAALTAAAVLAPWIAATPLAGAVGMAVLMTAVFLQLYRYLHRTTPVRFGGAQSGARPRRCLRGHGRGPGGDRGRSGLGRGRAGLREHDGDRDGGGGGVRRPESRDSYYTDIKRVQVASPAGAL